MGELPSARLLVAWLIALSVFAGPGRAQTAIVSVNGPNTGAIGIFPTAWVALSFTVDRGYSDVTIKANLIGSFQGTAFLMTMVGPGTTEADEIASGPFVSGSGFGGQLQTVLQGVTLPGAGTYLVVLSTTIVPPNPPQAIVTTNLPSIITDVGALNGPFMMTLIPPGTSDVTYPPAASFFVNPGMPGVLGEYEVAGIPVPATVPITIDIKPGSFPNSLNLGASGGIPVAILSTDAFNAPAEIDPATLTLEGATVRYVARGSRAQCSAEDVNGDGFADLVCHFTTDLALAPGGGIAVLQGQTYGGNPIRGEDSVRIVP